MAQWFRFYDEVLDDPKVQQLSGEDFKLWVNILCIACRNGGILPDVKVMSFYLRLPESEVQVAIERLRNGGPNAPLNAPLIDRLNGGPNGWHYAPHSWAKRQYKSDSSTERVKRSRNASRVADTDTDTDTDKSTPINPPLKSGDLLGDLSPPKKPRWPRDSFDKFWQTYPRKVGKEAARRCFERIHRLGAVAFADLLTATERYRADPGCEEQFIPHPTTWLNQGRYLDDRLAKPTEAGMTEVARSREFFEPLCRRFRRENGSEPTATQDGAMLPTKWVTIASEAENDDKSGLFQAGNGVREAGGAGGRAIPRH